MRPFPGHSKVQLLRKTWLRWCGNPLAGDHCDMLAARSQGHPQPAARARSLGRLVYESHLSLKEDYEVSCEELDVMVEFASEVEGVYGARITGGGFGGCTVNLVPADVVQEFEEHIRSGYREATGRTAAVYVCCAAQGAAKGCIRRFGALLRKAMARKRIC